MDSPQPDQPSQDPARLQEAASGVLAVPLHSALGMELIDPARPELGFGIEVGEMSGNNVGILHGGLTAALLDVAAYLALLPQLGAGEGAVTHSTSSQLLRGAAAGTRIRFEGEVVRRGRALAFCSARCVRADDGELIATGQIVKSIVPA